MTSSQGPMTADLDRHVIFQEAVVAKPPRSRNLGGKHTETLPILTNISLAIHAQTADPRLELPIPADNDDVGVYIDEPTS